jgi:LysM repeat protein
MMTLAVRIFGGVLLLLASWLLIGCGPSQSQMDEEKEPHFMNGKTRASAMDYAGAIECFEKALEVNPQSAAAHFELACLFDQKDSRESEPAEAIYHYNHYLKLRPNAENRELVNQHILTCKQQLAKTVSFGELTEKAQRAMEQLTEENKRLTEENKRLHEDIDKWTAYARGSQSLSNRSGPAAPVNRSVSQMAAGDPGSSLVAQSNTTASVRPSATQPTTAARSHTIKAGDTPTLIARKYNVKLESLMAANPGLNPKRLQVGQTLNIPSS